MYDRNHKAFSITVRPKYGITDDDVEKYLSWVTTYIPYSYTVTELHKHDYEIHSVIFLNVARRSDSIRRSLIHLFKFSPDENLHAIRVNRINNLDWLTYITKSDSNDVLHTNLPEPHLINSFFIDA